MKLLQMGIIVCWRRMFQLLLWSRALQSFWPKVGGQNSAGAPAAWACMRRRESTSFLIQRILCRYDFCSSTKLAAHSELGVNKIQIKDSSRDNNAYESTVCTINTCSLQNKYSGEQTTSIWWQPNYTMWSKQETWSIPKLFSKSSIIGPVHRITCIQL